MSDAVVLSGLTPIETEIVAVTVYPAQARVTRQGQLEVSPGDLRLRVDALPAVLEMGSLQIDTEGTAQISLQPPHLTPTATDDEGLQGQKEALKEQRHQAEDAFRCCKDLLSSLNHQQAFLESLAEQTAQSFAQGLSQQSITLANVAEFSDFFDQAYQQTTQAIVVQERRKHQLDLQLQQARQQERQVQSAAIAPLYDLVMPLTVHQAGRLDIQIIYTVNAAQWQPVYELRQSLDETSLVINSLAEIQQNTGEDWHQVALKVSTATAETTLNVPDIDRLTAPAPLPTSFKDKAPGSTSADSPAEVKSRSPVLEDTYRMLGALPGSSIPYAQQEAAGANQESGQWAISHVEFTAPLPATVPSDDSPHQVPVSQRELSSQLTYVALPQRSCASYLCAELINTSAEPLLPGAAHLFRSGGYWGEQTLDYVAPGEAFQLSLGFDERVTVHRQGWRPKPSSEPVGGQLRGYELTLQNPFSSPIEVRVIEQLPVNQNTAITPRLITAEPATTLTKTGQCHWSLRLEAQSQGHIRYQYEVGQSAPIAEAESFS